MKYEITRDYISFGNARSGRRLTKVKFITSHDTGNPGSTAYGNRNWFDRAQPSASAHTFIDDKEILEMIPLWEKAWHVQYQKPYDNERFGEDANDAAIGVELCWGPGINFDEAYRKYVWYHAHLCKQFGLTPYNDIASHKQLDPERRTDPDNALNRHGITWEQFLDDVAAEVGMKSKTSKWEQEVKDAQEWVKEPEVGISDGTRPNDSITRREVWVMFHRFFKLIKRLLRK